MISSNQNICQFCIFLIIISHRIRLFELKTSKKRNCLILETKMQILAAAGINITTKTEIAGLRIFEMLKFQFRES